MQKLLKKIIIKCINMKFVQELLIENNYIKKDNLSISLNDYNIECTLIPESIFFDIHYPGKSYDFIKSFNNTPVYIQHRTSLNKILSIIKTGVIFGCDGNRGAHFELPSGSGNGANSKGYTMYFKWNGGQSCTYSKEENHNTKPNILYHIAWYDYKPFNPYESGYWESRLYPNTENLMLFAIKNDNSHNVMLLNKDVRLKVVDCDKKLRHLE